MTLERIAWSLVILAGLIAAGIFFKDGFNGYALLAALLSLAASVNVMPGGPDESDD